MGHRLRTLKLEGNLSMKEKACENYECRSCGKKMVSVNFVTGICIQVFVSHGEACEYFRDAFHRAVEVTCETCRYFDREDSHCTYEGKGSGRIESVRTMV